MALKAVSSKSRLIPKRAKELNIIYFLDSNRTNSFKISMTQLKWILAGLISASLWAVFSVGFVTYQYSQNLRIEERLEVAIARLFEYQTRFEGVYEKAYPSEGSGNLAESGTAVALNSSAEAARTQPAKQTTVTGESTTASVTAAVNHPTAGGSLAAKQDSNRIELSAKTSSLVPVENSNAVRIENLALQFDQGNLSARFSLRNADSSTKAEGLLLGVAKFEATDGSVHYVGSPAGVRPDANGIATAPHEGFRFGIKFHKPKKLSFSVPSGKVGKFTEVKLFVSGTKRGDYHASFNVEEKVQRQFLAQSQAAVKPALSSAVTPTTDTLPNQTSAPESDSEEPALTEEDLTPSEDGGE